MKNYIELIQKIVDTGQERGDRTGTGTIGIFGHYLEHDLSKGFPLMTHKKVNFKSVAAELIWFLSGCTSNASLLDLGSRIWVEWADDAGRLGPIYGAQWRGTEGAPVDQVAQLLYDLKNDKFSRRHMVVAWSPKVLPKKGFAPSEQAQFGLQALPPCHFAFQMYVDTQERLSIMFHLRSSDTLLGLPFNIASYALLTHLFAKMLGYGVGKISVTLGDAHIYKNHLDSGGVSKILEAKTYPLPTFEAPDYFGLNNYYDPDTMSVDAYSEVLDYLFYDQDHTTLKQIMSGLSNYQHGDVIKFDVAV